MATILASLFSKSVIRIGKMQNPDMSEDALQTLENTSGIIGVLANAFASYTGNGVSYVLQRLKYVSAEINIPSQVMKHPQESGSTSADAKIVMPIEISIKAICPSLNAYDELKAAALDTSSIYFVTIKSAVYMRMVIESVGSLANPENLSASPVEIRLSQLLAVSSSAKTAAQGMDNPMKDLGQSALNQVKSTATNAVDKVKSILPGQ